MIGGGENAGATSATSVGLVLSTAYQSIPAATASDWAGFNLMILSRAAGATIDISVARGSSANEFTLIDQMRINDNGSSYSNSQVINLPLKVPAGERLSIKMSAASAGTQAYIMGYPPGFSGVAASGAYLERLAAAGGVVVDPGAVANTKGAWVSVGTTASEYRGLYVNMSAVSGISMDMLVDVGIDIAGSKMVLPGCNDIPAVKGSGSTLRPNVWPLVPCNLPAGSAVYARSQCTSTTSTSRNVSVNVFGLVG